MLKVTVQQTLFPASRWSPTFTGVLSMLCNSFLEFLSIVYNSFQRHPFIIFISCDVNCRVMLQENQCTKNIYYSLWSPSTLQVMKNNYFQFFSQVLDVFPLFDIPERALVSQYQTSCYQVQPFLDQRDHDLNQTNMEYEQRQCCKVFVYYKQKQSKVLLNSCLSSGKHPFDYFL